jgi:uncharacterized protein
MNSKRLYIKGMHCVACEKILEDELSQVPFVKKVEADRKKGQARIYWKNNEPNSLAMEEIIRKIGYEPSEKPLDENPDNKSKINPHTKELESEASGSLASQFFDSFSCSRKKYFGEGVNWQEWINAFLVMGIMIFLLKIFQNSGILNGIDLGQNNITYGVSFIIGLVASVSSCLAVVGAVIIAFSEKYKSEETTLFEKAVKPNLLFHLGRLITFFILGGILGLIGGEINISGNFISAFTIIIAFIMGWLGLNILGVLPSISNLGIRIPKKFSGSWNMLRKSNHKMAPLLLGGLTFFLPCGFTQSMQIFALASGSFLTGGMAMFLFSLGTVPALLILGITTSWTKNKGVGLFKKVAGLLVLFFAIYTLNSGLALLGVKNSVFSNDKKQNEKTSAPTATQEQQVVEMHITSGGFTPSVLKIKKGVPVRWVIKGDQVTSCTNKIIVPSLNITKSISFGENIVAFTPTASGEIPFSCWMGMVRGKFVVE